MPLGSARTRISKPAAAHRFEALRGTGVLGSLPALPEVRRLADQKFELLKGHPHHSSIRLKKLDNFGRHGLAFIIEHWPKSAPMASFGLDRHSRAIQ